MRLTRDGETLADARISTTCKVDKILLKAVNCDNLGNWCFGPGDVLSLRYINTGGRLYAEQGIQKQVLSVIIPDVDTLAGILIERPQVLNQAATENMSAMNISSNA